MFFGKNFGTLSNDLDFSGSLEYSFAEMLINAVILLIVFLVSTLIIKFGSRIIPAVLSILIFGGILFTVYNAVTVEHTLSEIDDVKMANKFAEVTPENAEKVIRLSRSGKNVVIFLLDRAIDGYIPYIFNEKPELAAQFSGFTYYPNTISFGQHTIFGAPAIYGGYEYTPDAMNKRNDVLMSQKVNESDLLMPLLFSNEGYTGKDRQMQRHTAISNKDIRKTDNR